MQASRGPGTLSRWPARSRAWARPAPPRTARVPDAPTSAVARRQPPWVSPACAQASSARQRASSVLSTAQRKGHRPQRRMAFERVEQPLEAAQRRLDPGEAAGQEEALDQSGLVSPRIGAPLAQGPQQQLLARAQLADDDVGKPGHDPTPQPILDASLDSRAAATREGSIL